MQASIEMDQGRSALKAIIAAFPVNSKHWNEAENRFQFVDRLLTECLGWEKPLIRVEIFDDAAGRADYLMGQPVRAALEAKKEAKKFSFLPTTKPTKARKLRPLVEACSVLRAACSQVINYCAQHGARLAIVCNGPQLVLFQSRGEGLSPLDGDCFVFDGFDAYVKEFATLWRFLSPEGVYSNSAVRLLSELQNPRVPIKASTIIGEPKAYRFRTDFQDNLRNLATILLENVEDNPSVKSEFYRECYVSAGAENRDTLLSEEIISARYRRVSDNGIVSADLSTKIENGSVRIDAGDLSTTTGRPLVVVGDVGVGKTSFFEHLFEQLDEAEKDNTCYIHINLGKEAALAASVKEYVLRVIPLVLREEYDIAIDSNDFANILYAPEIEEFEESVEGQLKEVDYKEFLKARIKHVSQLINDRSSHVTRALNYVVKGLGRQVLIVLDNADQRTFQTQQEAFLVAQELASMRSMLIFVALRPSTFYASKLSGALSGYKNEVLSISPPPADKVIRKRLIFALRIAQGKAGKSVIDRVTLDTSDVELFFAAMLRSIHSNPEIRTFLSNITGGNTRLVLELITSFCGSPNVESERIVRIERETGKYRVPLHEFAKHALVGEYSYYHPASSLVACNVFDVISADRKEHFLALLVIGYLSSPSGLIDNDGFVLGSSVLNEMMRLGFSERQIRASLRRLAERRLIETPHAHFRELPVDDRTPTESFVYRATSVGIYHARHWVGSFSFLDAMCIDTPIFDDKRRDVVMKLASSFDIKHRYEKATAFLEYLQEVWFSANFDMNYYDFQVAVYEQSKSFNSVEKFVRARD